MTDPKQQLNEYEVAESGSNVKRRPRVCLAVRSVHLVWVGVAEDEDCVVNILPSYCVD